MVGMLAALAAAALAATAGTEPPAAAAAAAAAAATQTRPSFVWILADDLEADWKQDRKEIMPNLKRALSEGGLEFVNHAAVVAVCGPSRSSLLSGRFPHNTGVVANAAQVRCDTHTHGEEKLSFSDSNSEEKLIPG